MALKGFIIDFAHVYVAPGSTVFTSMAVSNVLARKSIQWEHNLTCAVAWPAVLAMQVDSWLTGSGWQIDVERFPKTKDKN